MAKALRTAFIAALLVGMAMPVGAAEWLGGYTAFLGAADHFNSNGQRLTEPWQVIRQDRANFHKFGIQDGGDEWDPFFGDVNNRAALEQMLMRGTTSASARRAIVNSNVFIHVEIYGSGGRATSISVSVD